MSHAFCNFSADLGMIADVAKHKAQTDHDYRQKLSNKRA